MGRKIRLRILCSTYCFVYFFTTCAFAHKVETNLWDKRHKSIQVAQLPAATPTFQTLSPASGTVRKISVPETLKSKKVIIHIQDVHMNLEAQKNIGRALQELINQKKVDLVALEGAFAPIDLTPFRNFPHQDTIHKVADYLLRENKISGSIHTALTSPSKIPPIIGIDDAIHYQANVEAYKCSIPFQKRHKEKFNSISKELSEQKSSTFNKQLAAFDEQVELYNRGKINMGKYVQLLAKHASSVSPAIQDFLEAFRIESSLNLTGVETERTQLISELMAKLNVSESKTLMDASVAFRTGSAGHSHFYAQLRSLCENHGIHLDRYPLMSDYFRYFMLTEKMDAQKLFEEMNKLREVAYASLVKTEKEKTLINASRQLILSGKLLDFSLTKKEWEEYKLAWENSMSMRSRNSINKKLLDLMLITHAHANLSSFERFYEEAEIRDERMAENLLAVIARRPERPTWQSHRLINGIATVASGDLAMTNMVVLVTGGFHSSGIDQKLVDAGYTVLTFTPKITKVDAADGSAYLSAFAQEKTPLERLFEGNKLFLAFPPAAGVQDDEASLLARLLDPTANKLVPTQFEVADVEQSLHHHGITVTNNRNGLKAEITGDDFPGQTLNVNVRLIEVAVASTLLTVFSWMLLERIGFEMISQPMALIIGIIALFYFGKWRGLQFPITISEIELIGGIRRTIPFWRGWLAEPLYMVAQSQGGDESKAPTLDVEKLKLRLFGLIPTSTADRLKRDLEYINQHSFWSTVPHVTFEQMPIEIKKVFDKLKLKKDQKLLEIGPGQNGGIGLIAALSGLHVVMVERKEPFRVDVKRFAAEAAAEGRPSTRAEELARVKPFIEFFPMDDLTESLKPYQQLIKQAGGSIEIIPGDFSDSEIQKKVESMGPFDHVVATDVIDPTGGLKSETGLARTTSDFSKVFAMLKGIGRATRSAQSLYFSFPVSDQSFGVSQAYQLLEAAIAQQNPVSQGKNLAHVITPVSSGLLGGRLFDFTKDRTNNAPYMPSAESRIRESEATSTIEIEEGSIEGTFTIGDYEIDLHGMRQTMKDVGELLTADQERDLFRAYHAKNLSADERGQLRHFLGEKYLFLVRHYAKNSKRTDKEDAIQDGCLGLMKAIDEFDWQLGFRFGTYASWGIETTISHGMRTSEAVRISRYYNQKISKLKQSQRKLLLDLGREPKIEELVTATGISAVEIVSLMSLSRGAASLDAPKGDNDENFSLIDLLSSKNNSSADASDIISLMETELTPRERVMLKMRLGIGTVNNKDYSVKELQSIFDLSRQACWLTHTAAIEKIRATLESGKKITEVDPDNADVYLVEVLKMMPGTPLFNELEKMGRTALEGVSSSGLLTYHIHVNNEELVITLPELVSVPEVLALGVPLIRLRLQALICGDMRIVDGKKIHISFGEDIIRKYPKLLLIDPDELFRRESYLLRKDVHDSQNRKLDIEKDYEGRIHVLSSSRFLEGLETPVSEDVLLTLTPVERKVYELSYGKSGEEIVRDDETIAHRLADMGFLGENEEVYRSLTIARIRARALNKIASGKTGLDRLADRLGMKTRYLTPELTNAIDRRYWIALKHFYGIGVQASALETDIAEKLQGAGIKRFGWDPLESTCRHASLSIL